MVNLTLFKLNENQLTGSIPASFGNLTKITTGMWLENNMLDGSVPATLGNLTKARRLSLDRNRLVGPLPSALMDMASLQTLTTQYNALFTDDAALAAFIENLDPGWADTQTVAPTGFQVAQAQQTDVRLAWTPIAYTGDGGFYEIRYGTSPGGPYPSSVRTADKVADSIWLSGLTPDTTYYFIRSPSRRRTTRNRTTSRACRRRKSRPRHCPTTRTRRTAICCARPIRVKARRLP
ncbi:MAG: fibronectin type III domain-containing protein [Caldilineaceae bacterium]